MSSQTLILSVVALLLVLNAVAKADTKTEGDAVKENTLIFQGKQVVTGLLNETKTVVQFLGIKYAKDVERFKKAEILPPNGTVSATKAGHRCPQPGYLSENENCHFLNVYVPYRLPQPTEKPTENNNNNPAPRTAPGETNSVEAETDETDLTKQETVSSTQVKGQIGDQLLPVYVFIHGGTYRGGQGFDMNPSNLVAFGQVIVVNFNYRLGPLGFLTTDTEDIPANLGMHDQQLAIEWVKKYISHFGGDPNKITVGGQSSGSFNAMMLAMQEANKDLFQNVISESGTPFAPFSFRHKGQGHEVASALSKALGCNETVRATPAGIKECLSSFSTEALVNASALLPPLKPNLLNYLPVLDPEQFANDSQSVHFRQKNLLIGYNKDEASVLVSIFVMGLKAVNSSVRITDLSKDHFNTLTSMFEIESDLEKSVIKQRFFNWDKPKSFTRPALDLLTEVMYAVPAIKTALKHSYREPVPTTTRTPTTAAAQQPPAQVGSQGAEGPGPNAVKAPVQISGKTFMYHLNLDDTLKIPIKMFDEQTEVLQGSPHEAERRLIFGLSQKLGNDKDMQKLAKSTIEFFSSFIKTGEPQVRKPVLFASATFKFDPFSPSTLNHAEISKDLVTKNNGADQRELFHFWTQVVHQVKKSGTDLSELKKKLAVTPGQVVCTTPTTQGAVNVHGPGLAWLTAIALCVLGATGLFTR